MTKFAIHFLGGLATLLSSAAFAQGAKFTLADVIGAINSKDQVKLNQIVATDGTVLVIGSGTFGTREAVSRADFTKMMLSCTAKSAFDGLFLICPDQPTEKGACTHYSYSVSVDLSTKVEFTKAYKSMYVPRGCQPPPPVAYSPPPAGAN